MSKEGALITKQEAHREFREKARKTKVTLGMFDADALSTGKLDGMIDVFFGERAGWLGFYTNREREEVRVREERIKERYKRSHPDITDEEYGRYREDRLSRLNRRARGSINRRFDKAVKVRFDIERAPEDFAAKRLLDAGHTMERVADTLYPGNPSLHPRNETVLLPVLASRVVEQVTSDRVGEHLKREQVLRHLHAFIIAEHKRINGKLEAERKVSQIQDFLAANLFQIPQGNLIDTEARLVVDDITNEILFVDGIDGDIDSFKSPKGTHVKILPVSMRKIADSGALVLTNPDTKRVESSEIKAISRAKERFEKREGDEVRAVDDVHDTHRILFTVFGDETIRDDFANQLQQLLVNPENQKHLGDLDEYGDVVLDESGMVKGRVLSVENDSDTNGYSTQADVKFKRIQVFIEGLHAPIEIKIQALRDKLMDDWHIGTKDPETGFYNGRAHRLYELRRADGVREFYSPEEITGERSNLNAEIGKTQEGIVFELRNEAK